MRTTYLAACLSAVALFAAPARAAVGVGDNAPEMEGKEFINTPKITLKDLRGRVLIYDIFRTWWGGCNTGVGDLNKLYEKYKSKGLVVIGVTDEARGLVDAYVSKNSPKYPIVIESVDSGTTFGLQGGYPTQYLITPGGKIAWAGNFFDQAPNAEELIEKYLKEVRLAPDLPAKLDPVEKLIEKRKYAEARAALAKVAADEKADAGDRKAAEDTVKWIDDGATAALTTAQDDEKAGRIAEAAEGYEGVSTAYAGLEPATTAAASLKALLADPAKKKEVDGGKALAKAQSDASDLSPKKAIPLFKSVISRFKGTKAADKAAVILADLEKKAGK